ncbi:SAM domain and HD [Nowakowskiella sp. JEL0078]|nr:SAM domain and HD [Nowakowskiella sp. JEL0078]
MSYFEKGASHNRLGVGFLANKFVSLLRERQPELGITDVDIENVTIAALCHDLGHGPFSHVFDKEFISRTRIGREWMELHGERWTHENMSIRIFDFLLDDNRIAFDEERRSVVKEYILGDMKVDRGKPYLMDIVANKRNNFDLDKVF